MESQIIYATNEARKNDFDYTLTYGNILFNNSLIGEVSIKDIVGSFAFQDNMTLEEILGQLYNNKDTYGQRNLYRLQNDVYSNLESIKNSNEVIDLIQIGDKYYVNKDGNHRAFYLLSEYKKELEKYKDNPEKIKELDSLFSLKCKITKKTEYDFFNKICYALNKCWIDDISIKPVMNEDIFCEVTYDGISKTLKSENEFVNFFNEYFNSLDKNSNKYLKLSEQLRNIGLIKENEIQEERLQQINNIHDAIELVRQSISSKSSSIISTIKSVNPLNEFHPISIQDFQQELSKYNFSVDSSYIEGIVSQINWELGIQLVNKTSANILQSIISSTTGSIDLLNNEELMQKYGINVGEKYMTEILDYINNGIINENNKRQSQQQVINSNNVSKKEEIVDLFEKYPGYKRLYECFIELANTDSQKIAIEQIMKTGEFNGFKINSMLSNEKDSIRAERNRRIEFAEMILTNESLFLNLSNNGLNCFHGTEIDALDTILNKGLLSSTELSEQEIQLRTGEEYKMNQSNIYGGVEKRHFVSLTDDFKTSVGYAGFHSKEQIEFFKTNYGKELKDEPIIICFNSDDIAQKYGNSLVHVQSTCNEIGLTTSISPSDIKCIITSYEKIEYVQSLASKFGIDVLGYDPSYKFDKGLNVNSSGKFYTRQNYDIVIDEQEFARSKEALKEKLSKSNNSKTNTSSISDSYSEMISELNNSQNEIEQSTNKLSNSGLLNDDLSMKIASDVKMDIVFDLTTQYNSGKSIAPLTANALSARYNINERVAQQLAGEINSMVSAYIQTKEEISNRTPYVLDGFDEEEQEISHKHR